MLNIYVLEVLLILLLVSRSLVVRLVFLSVFNSEIKQLRTKGGGS